MSFVIDLDLNKNYNKKNNNIIYQFGYNETELDFSKMDLNVNFSDPKNIMDISFTYTEEPQRVKNARK
jgi:hypothetical protein